MGKAAKLKRMRKIASKLPVIERQQIQGERVIGDDLRGEGVDEVQGAKVEANQYYRRKKVVTVPINHAKAMKRNYNKFGMSGALGYARAVLSYEAKRSAHVEPGTSATQTQQPC